MSTLNYWQETVSDAADECGATLTPDQIRFIAEAVQSSHENYGLAFYIPPSTDRISEIKKDYQDQLSKIRSDNQQNISAFVEKICKQNNCKPSEVWIESGEVKIVRS